MRNDDKIKTIKIDAYVSPQMPAEYVSHKLSFLSTLAELSALSGGKIVVNVHEIENYSEDAANAQKDFGIEPREVYTVDRGAHRREEIFLGAAFTSGLDRVVVPFIDKGIPIEYEVLRSICTVAQQERKKLGVVKTDAQLFGGFSMQGPSQESPLVAELKKQYDVVEVDPSKPIKERYDVLLAIQPSSLNPDSMKNFVEAVKTGQPTAIFEDPLPLSQADVVGTSQQKRPPGGMMGMFGGGGQPEPKGDISQLWKLLGVEMYGDEIVWQDYNPTKLRVLFDEFVFVDKDLKEHGTPQPFDPDDRISADMNQVLFLFAGSFRPTGSAKTTVSKLAVTGTNSGTVNYSDAEMMLRGGPRGARRSLTREPYIMAAHVRGKGASDAGLYLSDKDGKEGKDAKAVGAKDEAVKDDKASGDGAKADDKEKAKEDDALAGKEADKTELNVVLVADIDWILADDIFRIRAAGQSEDDSAVDFQFQNIPFALNILDSLANDDRFIDLRKRTRSYEKLTKIEAATEEQQSETVKQQSEFEKDATKQIEAAQAEFRKKIADIEARTDLDPRQKELILQRERLRLESILNANIKRFEKDRDSKMKQSERELAAKIRGVQDQYKLLAVLVPPIPPILLAFFVFFNRRKAEREGVSTRRLRYGKSQEQSAD
jgi:ABC-2 type transport system permease protein